TDDGADPFGRGLVDLNAVHERLAHIRPAVFDGGALEVEADHDRPLDGDRHLAFDPDGLVNPCRRVNRHRLDIDAEPAAADQTDYDQNHDARDDARPPSRPCPVRHDRPPRVAPRMWRNATRAGRSG